MVKENDDQGNAGQAPEPGFDERVSDIVQGKMLEFMNEQLPVVFDKVVATVTEAVKKDLPQGDTEAITESAALKAVAILQKQGEQFIKDTVADAQPAQAASPPAGAAPSGTAEPAPANQPSQGQQIWNQVKSDPGTMIDHLFSAWERIERMRRPDPYATLKNLEQTHPELLGLFVPDPLGANTQSLMVDAMRIGLRAKAEAGQIDPLDSTGIRYNDSVEEPQPTSDELEPASAAHVPMTGAGSAASKRERPRRVKLADLARLR